MPSADEDVIELREKLQQVARQVARPELVDVARRDATALPPVRDRGQSEELVRVVEDRKEELVVALELRGGRSGRHGAGEAGGARGKARELVNAPRSLHGGAITGIDTIGARDLADDILELVLEAEGD
jgi:hypothetical protein